jgi:hypothetical protein
MWARFRWSHSLHRAPMAFTGGVSYSGNGNVGGRVGIAGEF